MGYLLTQMLFYMLAALALGVFLGWLIWGRLRTDVGELQVEIARQRGEAERLRAELNACGRVRDDLEAGLVDAERTIADLRARRVAPLRQDVAPQQPAAALLSAKKPPAPKPAPEPEPIDRQPQLNLETHKAEKKVAAVPAAKPDPAPEAKSEPASKKPRKKTAAASEAPSKSDDLRRIIGIGPVNERLLHAQNIRTFAQIAAWTAGDVKRIEDVLQFDGRIARERWIEQAKLLAAGDDQEFASRFPTANTESNS